MHLLNSPLKSYFFPLKKKTIGKKLKKKENSIRIPQVEDDTWIESSGLNDGGPQSTITSIRPSALIRVPNTNLGM